LSSSVELIELVHLKSLLEI